MCRVHKCMGDMQLYLDCGPGKPGMVEPAKTDHNP
jgi:hypothetical protein